MLREYESHDKVTQRYNSRRLYNHFLSLDSLLTIGSDRGFPGIYPNIIIKIITDGIYPIIIIIIIVIDVNRHKFFSSEQNDKRICCSSILI